MANTKRDFGNIKVRAQLTRGRVSQHRPRDLQRFLTANDRLRYWLHHGLLSRRFPC